mmetsp:Transcript_37718/g.82658  ORF Transcript_37718/g.82658 Transcript_37718/m.82658 type:complete len:670 (+) Transcript_37718:169-2178(+)
MGGALSSPCKDEMSAAAKAKSRSEGVAATGAGRNFVLPEEEYFFSISLVPGCTADEAASPTSSPFHGAYWRSKSRKNHLRWAMHRGIEHGCQPCMFWRTAFVEEPSKSSTLAKPHARRHSSLEIVRYLSQFAFDFVFGTNSRQEQKRRVIIYIVSPDHDDLSAQVDLIKQIWDEASIGGVEPICVVLDKEDFDERILCHPPRMSEADEALVGNSSIHTSTKGTVQSDADKQDNKIAASAEQIALLRGAGFLYGYPSLVFNCSPLSIDCICCDERGEVTGLGGGFGLSPKLRELLPLSRMDSDEVSEESFPHLLVGPPIDATFVETRQEVRAVLGDKVDEVLDNARTFVAYWIYSLNLESRDKDTAEARRAADNAALHRLELIVAAMENNASESDDDQEPIKTQRTPVFGALYQRRNSKRSVVISGGDLDLLSDILDTNKVSNNAAIAFNALSQHIISSEDGALRFPWNDSSAASCRYKEMDEDVSYSSRRQICPIQKNLHLAHYGVAASVMGHYITGRFSNTVIGRRVAKRFINPAAEKEGGAKAQVGEIYRGYLAKVEEKGGEDWYYIRYDDGDTEHVARPELIEMIGLYTRVGEDGNEEYIPGTMKTGTTSMLKGKKRLASQSSTSEENDKNGDGQSSDIDGNECTRGRRQRRRQMPLCRDGVYHFF